MDTQPYLESSPPPPPPTNSPTVLTTLPTELLLHILSLLPPSSLFSLRLTSHRLETLSFPLLFSHLTNWLDYKTSHAAILALANDAYERPSVMWSPWASEPDEEVSGIWLGILWRVERKAGFVLGCGKGDEVAGRRDRGERIDSRDTKERVRVGGGEEEEDEEEGVWVDGGVGERVWLTARNYKKLSGREEMDEKRLSVAQNRYLMHRNYSNVVGKKMGEVEEGDARYGEERTDANEGAVEARWEEKEL